MGRPVRPADRSAAERGPADRPGSAGRGGGGRRPRRRADHGGLAGPQGPRPPSAVRVGRGVAGERAAVEPAALGDRKSTRLNSSHTVISYAVLCLKKKNNIQW